MTSPVSIRPAPKKRRSLLKRQRTLVAILLAAVILLGAAFGVVYYITSRTVFKDWDGTKYYIAKMDGAFVMTDRKNNLLGLTEDGYYVTESGTIVDLDNESGEFKVVAAVQTTGTEALSFSKYKGEFDILLYPMLERKEIQSIEVHNAVTSFAFRRNDEGFEIVGYPDVLYDSNMFATLVIVTGYTSTYMRIDAETARAYGYAEYGLPDDPDAAVNYFIITDTSGNSHKVVIGDEVPPGTGYYARYAGRDEVYVLKELEETDYSTTLSGALFTTVETYVQPVVADTMAIKNYFDVSNFMLNRIGEINDEVLNDPNFDVGNLMTNIITFSYSPIQIRQNTFYSTMAYTGGGAYEGFGINNYKVDECLQNLLDMVPLRCVELLSDEDNADGVLYFAVKYGLAYCMEYRHNLERDASNGYRVTDTGYTYQQIWISPMTENGTYYLYNMLYQMVVEVDRSSMEHLEWSPADWVDADIFMGNIVYLRSIECFVPGGTTAGRTGLTHVLFEVDNTESLIGWEQDAGSTVTNVPSDKMKVWGGGEQLDLAQFKNFNMSLFYSTLAGTATCSAEQAEAFRVASAQPDFTTADGQQPVLVVRETYNSKADGSGDTIVRTFCFYRYSARQCFVTLNGRGDFYMLQSRVDKLLRDIGLVFTPETPIDPTAKK